MERHIYGLLKEIGEDPDREGLKKTPSRVARALTEITAGYRMDIDKILNGAFFRVGYKEMVIVKDISFHSLCVPSKQLVNAVGGAKPARNIRTGDELWTLEKGRLVKTSVESAAMRKTRDIVEISTEKGRFKLTPDHPVMCEGEWKEAGELNPGDKIEWTPPKSLCREQYEATPGYPLGYFLGAVGSDGSVQDGRRIALIVKKRQFAEKFAAMSRQAFPGLKPRIESINVPSGFLKAQIPMSRVRIVSSGIGKKVCRWFSISEQGSGSKTRSFRFPQVVTSSREMMQGFLDGYSDGDGYSVNSGGRFIISANKPFLSELGKYLETPIGDAASTASRVYVSKNWDREGWYGRHGFKKEADFHVPIDSRPVMVTAVRKLPKAKKPHIIYSFKCSPYPTFLVSGHLTHNCEHHMLPFFGTAHIAYIPDGKIIGLSKIPRLVDAFAKRLQVQERLTVQIADTLFGKLRPKGVGVVVEARHLCMTMRGIKNVSSYAATSSMLGVFQKDNRVREEFLNLIKRAPDNH